MEFLYSIHSKDDMFFRNLLYVFLLAFFAVDGFVFKGAILKIKEMLIPIELFGILLSQAMINIYRIIIFGGIALLLRKTFYKKENSIKKLKKINYLIDEVQFMKNENLNKEELIAYADKEWKKVNDFDQNASKSLIDLANSILSISLLSFIDSSAFNEESLVFIHFNLSKIRITFLEKMPIIMTSRFYFLIAVLIIIVILVFYNYQQKTIRSLLEETKKNIVEFELENLLYK